MFQCVSIYALFESCVPTYSHVYPCIFYICVHKCECVCVYLHLEEENV